jgi:hypothetical protein
MHTFEEASASVGLAEGRCTTYFAPEASPIRWSASGMQAWSLGLVPCLRGPRRNSAAAASERTEVSIRAGRNKSRFALEKRAHEPDHRNLDVRGSGRPCESMHAAARDLCRGSRSVTHASGCAQCGHGALSPRALGKRWRKVLDRTQWMTHESTTVNAAAPNDCAFAACDRIARSAGALGRSAGSVLVLVITGAGAAAA